MGSINGNQTSPNSLEKYSEEETCLLAMQLSAGSVVPMALKAALELDLLELIHKADKLDSSAAELAAQLPTRNPDAASMIDRLLRLLAAFSTLHCSLKTLPDGGSERRYSIGALGKFFIKNEDGASLGSTTHMIQDEVIMASWYKFKDAVLEGGVPFNKAHGMSIFEYTGVDERFNKVLNQSMSQPTVLLKKIFAMYKGFEGIKTLVDVAGGIGATLNMVVTKYPTIKGINFDLPHVIKQAPSFPGIEHIGGDMFDSVPEGDAIFMKWIIHDWGDEDCVKILKNCYKSLPANGKVIIVDFVLPEIPTSGPAATALQSDLMMLAFVPGGKERTEREFEILAKKAGFKGFRNICGAYTKCVMELYK